MRRDQRVDETIAAATAHSLLMGLRTTELVVVWWCVAAAAVALVRPIGPRAQGRVIGGAAALAMAAFGVARLPDTGVGEAVRTVVPALFVLGALWVAAGYFVHPDEALEARLLAVDRWALRSLRVPERLTSGPRWWLEGLELAYLAVYPLLPLGAWAAWAQGRAPFVDRYWTVVFVAEATCYLALAWLQTRPPRDLEGWTAALPTRSLLRTLNETLLARGGHRRNTIPSGHAAGAVAVALALAWLQSPFWPAFGVAAVAICIATVVGRYHFLVDTVAGVAVAAAAWWVVRGVF